MSERRVYKTGKDKDGDITSLCNAGEAWSPRSKANAIYDIDNNIHSYYVSGAGGRSEIGVVNGASGKYLRTTPDNSTGNNLDELPDC